MGKVNSTDRIWNAQAWGSWFEFALPGVPVAVDSRIEVIPVDAWADHIALSAGLSYWESILDRWQISVVVASRRDQAALIPLMEASPGWSMLYQDADGVVFTRGSADLKYQRGWTKRLVTQGNAVTSIPW